jgi:hypothetical protein
MLTLRRLTLVPPPFAGASIFSTPRDALEHLCDHVLTLPEADCWSRLLRCFADRLGHASPDALYRFALSLWSDRASAVAVETAQALYGDYAAAIEQALAEAVRLGWYWRQDDQRGPSWHGVGLSGVYLIWRRSAVLTAFLIGYAAPPADPATRRGRRSDPLPRQGSWLYRAARLRHTNETLPPPPDGSPEGRYHLFKRCAVRVRKEHRAARLAGKVAADGPALGSLRDGVPGLDAWRHLHHAHAPQPPSTSRETSQ